MKSLSTWLLLLVLALCGLGLILTDPPKPATVPPVPVVTISQQLKTDVQSLAYSRRAGSQANQKARAYVADELKKAGLEVLYQKFPTGVNVIGTLHGATNKTIVIGSHYDSVSGSPGADDNASGCAMTLLLARQLSKTKPLHTIKFILFDDEEGGLNGSDYYVNTLEGQCDFMVNCDMVGTMKTGTPDTAVAAAFRKYPWAQAITYRDARGGSDHDGFTRRGIPNVFIHTGLHSRYHEKTDTASTLNYGGMDKINEFLLYLVRTFDKDAGQIKSFVRALPPYTGI